METWMFERVLQVAKGESVEELQEKHQLQTQIVPDTTEGTEARCA